MKKRLQEKANGSALKRRRRLIVRNFAAGRCSRQLFALPAHRAVWQKIRQQFFAFESQNAARYQRTMIDAGNVKSRKAPSRAPRRLSPAP